MGSRVGVDSQLIEFDSDKVVIRITAELQQLQKVMYEKLDNGELT